MPSKPESEPTKPTHFLNAKPTPRESRVLATAAKPAQPKGGKT